MKRRKKRINKGLYWHVHHEPLLEYCYNAKERIAYINRDKSPDEIPIRLRRMKRVKLPPKLKREYDMIRKLHRMEVCSWTGPIERWLYRHAREFRRLHNQQCKRCTWKRTKGGSLLHGNLFG